MSKRRKDNHRVHYDGIGIFTWILFAAAIAMLVISGVSRYTQSGGIQANNAKETTQEVNAVKDSSAQENTEAKATEKNTEAQTKETTSEAETTTQEPTEETMSNKDMLAYINDNKDLYSEELVSLANRYDEAVTMVYQYPENKDKEVGNLDISSDYKKGEIPLFLQFDERWGYQVYGINPMGVSGCGPTSIAMVYVGLTGDTTQNPSTIAKFSVDNSYYVKGQGTSWKLMTEGAQKLGLTASQMALKEDSMIKRLQDGGALICSVKAGDFADSGHFIVITGYDEDGEAFKVNNSSRTADSEKLWDFETLKGQIKAMWGYTYSK